MGTNKISIGVSLGLLLMVALIYWGAEKKFETKTISSSITIEQSWELPQELAELSGIAFLDDTRIVGVQDENGSLYVYNLDTEKIEQEIPFGENGDYEGIALSDSTAYVLRSDGTVLEISDYLQDSAVSEIRTNLTEEQDAEGLYFDQPNDRLLLAIKGNDPRGGSSKGIYGIDLGTGKQLDSPVFDINLEDTVFQEVRLENIQDSFKPSEVTIHPETGNILVLEGQEAKLLILDPEGSPQGLIVLEEADFPQPEGLAFDASGNLYISNEGTPATIHRVTIIQDYE